MRKKAPRRLARRPESTSLYHTPGVDEIDVKRPDVGNSFSLQPQRALTCIMFASSTAAVTLKWSAWQFCPAPILGATDRDHTRRKVSPRVRGVDCLGHRWLVCLRLFANRLFRFRPGICKMSDAIWSAGDGSRFENQTQAARLEEDVTSRRPTRDCKI